MKPRLCDCCLGVIKVRHMRHTRSQSRSWADNAIVGYWPLPTTRHLTKPRCSAPAAEFRAQGGGGNVAFVRYRRIGFAPAGVEPALRSGSHPRPNGLADGSAWTSGREYITQPQPSSGSASCSWCERRFQVRQSGGHAHPAPFRDCWAVRVELPPQPVVVTASAVCVRSR